MTNKTGAVKQLTQILEDTFGVEIWDDSSKQTAQRVLKAWGEFSPADEPDFKETVFDAVANQMIVVANIEFSSLCAHHLFPYSGVAHVGYLPNQLQIGLSKIPRIVHYYATRPSVQEQLTRDIASHIKKLLSAQGVAVVIEGQHTCMTCRGVRAHNAKMITSEMRGSFLTSGEARTEFISLIKE